jgi:hypothetical protein
VHHGVNHRLIICRSYIEYVHSIYPWFKMQGVEEGYTLKNLLHAPLFQ